jgi:hypothetical protein
MQALQQGRLRARLQQQLGCRGVQKERDPSLLDKPGEPLARHSTRGPRHELGAIHRVGIVLLGRGQRHKEIGKQQKNKGLTVHFNSSAGETINRWQLAT